jgi:sulfite exporter TauE/SafE
MFALQAHAHHQMANPFMDPTGALTLWAVFIASLVASVHCLGMCGPLVALAGTAQRDDKWRPWSQIPLNLGRIATYSLMGIAAGAIGAAFERGGLLWDVQGVASLIGGAAMIFFAVVLIGWIPLPWALRVSETAVHRFSKALASRHPLGGFTVGLHWGLLPCGLVYLALGAAAATASPLGGAVVMAVFGLGTTPAMLVMGQVGGLIGPRLRLWLPRIASVSIMMLGVLMILRGASSAGWIGKIFIAPHVPLY